MPKRVFDVPSTVREHEKYFAEKYRMTETEASINLAILGLFVRGRAGKITKLILDIPHLSESEAAESPEKMGGADVMISHLKIFANYTDKQYLESFGDTTILNIKMPDSFYTTYKKAANKANTTMRQMFVMDMWTGIITDLAADRIEDEVESDILEYGRNMTSRQIEDIMKKKTFVRFVRAASVWRRFQTSKTANKAYEYLKNAPEILPSGANNKPPAKESIHD